MNQHGFHCRCPRCCAEEEQLSSQDALQQAVEDAVGTAAAIKEVLTPKGGQAGGNGSSKGGRSGGSSMTGSQEESGRWVADKWGCWAGGAAPAGLLPGCGARPGTDSPGTDYPCSAVDPVGQLLPVPVHALLASSMLQPHPRHISMCAALTRLTAGLFATGGLQLTTTAVCSCLLLQFRPGPG